jgi:hypothetical protein
MSAEARKGDEFFPQLRGFSGRWSSTHILTKRGVYTYRDHRPMNKLIIGLSDKTAELTTKQG